MGNQHTRGGNDVPSRATEATSGRTNQQDQQSPRSPQSSEHQVNRQQGDGQGSRRRSQQQQGGKPDRNVQQGDAIESAQDDDAHVAERSGN